MTDAGPTLTIERILDASRIAVWRYWSLEDRKSHEDMDFHAGWNPPPTSSKRWRKRPEENKR